MVADQAGTASFPRVRRAVPVLAAALIAGCSAPAARPGPVGPVGPVATVPGPVPAATGVVVGSEPDRAPILAAYGRFWAVAQRLDRNPVARWRPLLAPLAADPLLSRVLAALAGRVQAGYRQFGEVRVHPRLVAAAPERASVLDCQDASGAGEMDEATGLPTEVGAPRTPVAATLVRGADAAWRVADARYLPGGC
jgi:hypothetical protein